jgi:hypothetical protein
MVTKKELEGVLDQVNAILKSMDERLKALEEKNNSKRIVKKT